MARIVLNPFGSFGDLHPFLALAIALKRRGHELIVATAEIYRGKIEGEGLQFSPVRPKGDDLLERPDLVRRLWDPKRGTEYLIREYVMPQVRDSFYDLLPVAKGADLLITHGAGYAGPILAEYLEMRWLSVALQPAGMFSALDPSVLAPAPRLRYLYWLGPFFYRMLLRLGDRELRGWCGPVEELRRELGLPPATENPVMRGQFSPYGTLALFSEAYAAPQADWPANTVQTGFIFYDRLGMGPTAGEGHEDLDSFLGAGEAPVLFTLGSSALMEPGSFYGESLQAALRLGVRAVLLIGRGNRHLLPSVLPASIFIAEYLPYSEIMPRVRVVVHQGGIGTTAQALRAGRPMLVVPWAHDQPDNAERVRRLGVGRTLDRAKYTARSAARALRHLLSQTRYEHAAEQFKKQIASEDGESSACEVVEAGLP